MTAVREEIGWTKEDYVLSDVKIRLLGGDMTHGQHDATRTNAPRPMRLSTSLRQENDARMARGRDGYLAERL